MLSYYLKSRKKTESTRLQDTKTNKNNFIKMFSMQ